MPRRPGNAEISKNLGARIKSTRQTLGMSQAQLANLIGSTPPSISRLEAGHMAPTLTTLFTIANAMGVAPSSLLPPLATDETVHPVVGLNSVDHALVLKFHQLTKPKQNAVLSLLDIEHD